MRSPPRPNHLPHHPLENAHVIPFHAGGFEPWKLKLALPSFLRPRAREVVQNAAADAGAG